MTGSTKARGYGAEHKKLRAELLPQAYGQPCTRCGRVMRPGQALDLDHTDDRRGYRGMAHATCNRRAAAIKSNKSPKRRGRGQRQGRRRGPYLSVDVDSI